MRAVALSTRGIGTLSTLLFLAFAAGALSVNLGSGSLLPSDDAIYAQASREALAVGRFLDVTWQGHLLFEKGPILFWALEAAEAVGGPTDLAVRIPGVVAAVALLALLIAVARAAGLSRGAALSGVGLVLATNLLVFNARRPMTDIPGTVLGLAGFLLVAFGEGRGRSVAGGALLGLSALVKVVAPAPYVMALLLLQADRSFRRPARLGLALVVAAAVALPWHVAMAVVHGSAFLDTYVGFHLFRRAAVAVVGDGPGIYVAWFAEREGVTAVLLLAAVATAVVASIRGDRASRAALALLAGASLPLAASRTSLPHYLVPLLPGLGLAGAVAVGAAWRAFQGPGRPPDPGTGGAPGGPLAAPHSSGLRRIAAVSLALALVATFLGSNASDLARPDYGPGAKAVCGALLAAGEIDRLAATVDLHDPAIPWYCDRFVDFLGLDPGFLAATTGIPMLKGVARRLDADGLRDLAARGAVLVTVPARVDALSSLAESAGVRLSEARVVEGRAIVSLHM